MIVKVYALYLERASWFILQSTVFKVFTKALIEL